MKFQFLLDYLTDRKNFRFHFKLKKLILINKTKQTLNS
jgi:hypothetical protein